MTTAPKTIALFALLACTFASAGIASAQIILQVSQYTEDEGRFALGYPVPIPVDSLTPVDGFRTYESLQARHLDLALGNDRIEVVEIGRSLEDRPILAYRFGDPDDSTLAGLPEPAMLVNGTIHAREWQSPEVVTELFERLAMNANDGGLYQYLSDNTTIVLVPVSNPDGFLQAQRWPDEMSELIISGVSLSLADGRVRRKNKRDSDDDLFTFGDQYFGVDLNRNFPVGFGGPGSSPIPRFRIYHGESAASEPETQAIIAAADLGPADRLRLFVDVHSHGKVFFPPLNANERRNDLTLALVAKAQSVLADVGSTYTMQVVADEVFSGTTDEYHAETYQIPSWTLEIEPDPDGGLNYGGLGARLDGFILPDSEIARVRAEHAQQHAMVFYHQAGPPSIAAVRVVEQRTGRHVHISHWKVNHEDGQRTRRVWVNKPLRSGHEYRLWVAFDKPMRNRVDGEIAPYPGLDQPNLPTLVLGADGTEVTFDEVTWLDEPGGAPNGYRRYRDDAVAADFTLPRGLRGEPLSLEVTVADFALQQLDANPTTPVDWIDGSWSGYEDSEGVQGDIGGTDSTVTIGRSPWDLGSAGWVERWIWRWIRSLFSWFWSL